MRDDWRGDGRMPISFRARIVVGGGGGGPVLPEVASATLLLNLQADALVLSDSDPVGTWADQSGNNRDFTQTGDARPTFVANKDGYPAVKFDGMDFLQWMEGPSFADNLTSFAVFYIASQANPGNDKQIITKLNNDTTYLGWEVLISSVMLQDDLGMINIENEPTSVELFKVRATEFVDKSTVHVYVSGNDDAEMVVSSATITSSSNVEPVRLGADAAGIGSFTGLSGWIRAVMLYAPAPNATDRQAIIEWLATKYGIDLGFPTMTLQPPVTPVVIDGQSVSLSAEAAGNPTPTVQWQSKLTLGEYADIEGATSTTLAFTWHTGDDNIYRAVFTNTLGSIISNECRFSYS